MFGRDKKQRIFGIEKFKGLFLAGSFSVVVEFLLGFSDSVIAGNMIGANAFSGINLISPIVTSVTFLATLIGAGTGINYSLESGRCDRKRAHQFFTQGVWTAGIVGVTMAILFAIFRDAFIAYMSPGAEVAQCAREYWNWFIPCAILEPLVILLVNVSYTDGDSKLCMGTYVLLLVFNVAVSIIATKHMGVGGCSFGTAVSNLLAIGVLSCHFLRKCNTFKFVRHFSLRDSFKIAESSFGDASSFLCSALCFFFLNKFFIARFGSELLPVLSVVIETIGFLELFNGVGTALSPVVTVYSGEGNSRAIRRLMRTGLEFAVGEGLIVSLLLIAFPQLVVNAMGIDEPTLHHASCMAVRIVSLGLTFTSIVYLFSAYYLFIGRQALSVWVTLLGTLVSPVVLVLMLAAAGVYGVWAALALAPPVAVLAFSIFIYRHYGVEMFPLMLPYKPDANICIFNLDLESAQIVETSRKVEEELRKREINDKIVMRAALMTEEVLMEVKDRNPNRRIMAEVTLDFNDGIRLTLRDDGKLFDITDADISIGSLRSYLVSSVMAAQPYRMNLATTGFNRNVFKF